MSGSSGNPSRGLTRSYSVKFGGDATGNHGRNVAATVASQLAGPMVALRNPLPEAPIVGRDTTLHHENV